jgi:hypothetical protein
LLTKNHRQEALSRAYIQAVAARCGMSCSFRDFDYGIDVTVHEIKRRGEHYAEWAVSLDIQAKSLCGPRPAEAERLLAVLHDPASYGEHGHDPGGDTP